MLDSEAARGRRCAGAPAVPALQLGGVQALPGDRRARLRTLPPAPHPQVHTERSGARPVNCWMAVVAVVISLRLRSTCKKCGRLSFNYRCTFVVTLPGSLCGHGLCSSKVQVDGLCLAHACIIGCEALQCNRCAIGQMITWGRDSADIRVRTSMLSPTQQSPK